MVSNSRPNATSGTIVRAAHATGPHVVVYQFPNSYAFAQSRADVSEMNEFISRLNRKAEKNKLSKESAASEIMHFHFLLSKFQDNFGASQSRQTSSCVPKQTIGSSSTPVLC